MELVNHAHRYAAKTLETIHADPPSRNQPVQRSPATSFASSTFVVSPRPRLAASSSARSPIRSRAWLRRPIIAALTSRRCPRSSNVAAPERPQRRNEIAATSPVTRAIVRLNFSAPCCRRSLLTTNIDRMLSDSPSSASAARNDARCSALAASDRTRASPPSDRTAVWLSGASRSARSCCRRSVASRGESPPGSGVAGDCGSTDTCPRRYREPRDSSLSAYVARVDPSSNLLASTLRTGVLNHSTEK